MGKMLWGMVPMVAFAVSFSLSLAVTLFGVSLEKASLKVRKGDGAIRAIAGSLLVAAGLYLLGSFQDRSRVL